MNELHEKLQSLESKYKMFHFQYGTNTLAYTGPDDYQKVTYLVMITNDLEKLDLQFRMDDEDTLVVYI